MATSTSLARVQELYVAYYGRAADYAGREYWADRMDSEGEAAIIDAFANSAESIALYGNGGDAAQIDAIYTNVLGRAADDAGKEYYLAEIAAGRMTAISLATNIVDGAQGGDATYFANAVAAANTTTDADAPATPISGQTFTMTSGIDAITGTDGDDVINGALLSANGGDSVDGGDGNDTLNIATTSNIADDFTASNVENLSVEAYGTISVDMKNIKGVTSITSNESTGALTFNNVATNAAVTLKGAAGAATVNFTSAAIGGTSDALQVNLSGATGGNLTVAAGFESVSVHSVSASTLAGLTVPGVTTLVTSGADLTVKDNVLNSFTTQVYNNTGKVTLGADSAVTLIQAANNSAGVVAQTNAAADTQGRVFASDTLTMTTTGGTVLTGSGDDSLKITGASASGTDTIRLGDGNDKLDYALNANSDAVIEMGDGDDTLFLSAAVVGSTSDTFNLGAGNDTVIINDVASYVAKLVGAENINVQVNTDGSSLNLDGSSAAAITLESGTADAATTLSNLTAGSTITTINADAANKVATDGITVGFKAQEASTTMTFNNAVGDGDTGDILTVTKVTDLTLDFNEAVSMGTGAIETMIFTNTTDLTIDAAKTFAVDDITVAADKVVNATITGADSVEMADFNGTSIQNVSVTGAKNVTVGTATAQAKLDSVSVTSSGGTATIGNIGNTGSTDATTLDVAVSAAKAVSVGTIDAAKIGTITATSSASTVGIGAINDTDEGDMGVITATAKGTVTLGKIGDGTSDKLTSLTASSTDGAITMNAAGIDVGDADGYTVSLTAATTIDSDGSGTATVIKNTSGNIDLIDLNGTAVGVVDATVATSGYVKSFDASGLTGGLTSTITNAEAAASVSSNTTVSLGAATSATVNTVTFAGDVDAVTVTGSSGKDGIVLKNTVDSGTIALGSGTDTLTLTLLDGKVSANNAMVANFSSSSQTVGNATVSSGYIQEWDGTNALTNGVKIYVSGVDAVVGTNTADTIYANGTGMTITGGVGADLITLGAGADTVAVGAAESNAAAGVDVITGFATTTDSIDFAGAAGSSSNYAESTTAAASFTAVLAAADTALNGTVLYYFGTDGTDGWLFYDADGTANATTALDAYVKLAGVTDMAYGDLIA
jgi:S-layer protein